MTAHQPESECTSRTGQLRPHDVDGGEKDDRLDFAEVWDAISRRRLLASSITLAFTLAAALYGLLATEWYRAEAVLAPSSGGMSVPLAAQFSGLANLAGLGIDQGRAAEPIAILRSKGFARKFIESHRLEPILLADRGFPRARANDERDVRDAVLYFQQNVLKVSEDKRTGLVTVAIEWTDPDAAALWARTYVEQLNETMRVRALSESQANIGYLQSELEAATVTTLREAIGRLLESELQRSMVAKGDKEYAFKFLDEPEVPKYRSRPHRSLFLVIGVFVGLMVSLLVVVTLGSLQKGRD